MELCVKKGEREKWYVFYTKSRSEKKVNERLAKDFEVYLPLRKVLKRWTDRKKWVEEPLISSYIFVKTKEYKIQEILRTYGVVTYVRYCSRPAVVRDEEIDFLKRFCEANANYEISNDCYEIASNYMIESGPFSGMECKVVDVIGKKKLMVEIKEICYKVLVDIENSKLSMCN